MGKYNYVKIRQEYGQGGGIAIYIKYIYCDMSPFLYRLINFIKKEGNLIIVSNKYNKVDEIIQMHKMHKFILCFCAFNVYAQHHM